MTPGESGGSTTESTGPNSHDTTMLDSLTPETVVMFALVASYQIGGAVLELRRQRAERRTQETNTKSMRESNSSELEP